MLTERSRSKGSQFQYELVFSQGAECVKREVMLNKREKMGLENEYQYRQGYIIGMKRSKVLAMQERRQCDFRF